jgi:chromosome segregation ATPase
MIRSSLLVRRFVTVVGVVAVLALGVGSIRAAAAWTAASAPLTVAPVSVESLEASLADERARSAALVAQLSALDDRSRVLASALESANARIEGDASHADDLSKELAAATRKLEKLEAAISKARAALARQATVRPAPAPAAAPAARDDDDHEDEDDEHEEGEDDD